jgi:seryl-tRNA synthetase
MLDIKRIRERPDEVREGLKDRGADAGVVDQVLELDRRRRAMLTESEGLKNRRNAASKEIGALKKKGEDTAAAQAAVREMGDRIASLDGQVREVDVKLEAILLRIPNVPHASLPKGPDKHSNRVARQHGQPRTFDFTPKSHVELGERLGILDFARSTRLSATGFPMLVGAGARLERALISYMLDLHVREHGYTEMYVPYLVRQQTMVGSGNLPKFADNLYHDAEDDLWLIPTAEVALTNLHRDEILEASALPIYYVAHTPCFRREKAAAGRDTRGIKRVHQFEKVEMYKFVAPETSDQELTRMVGNAEEICQRLGISHRVLQLCTGDLGFVSAKTFDIEMWAPGSGEWLEVSSCSNCTDFQARRANVRYRPQQGARPQHVHTLNGSGLALPRVILSILENYQQADGSVAIPDVLRPYTSFDRIPPT